MHVSDNFFTILKKFEGFISCPYKDQVGIPTIGIGTTYYPGGKKVSMDDPCITLDKAFEYVRNYIAPVEALISSELPNANQNQFDSLVSFAYNVGTEGFRSSTLLKKAKKNITDPTIRDEFMKWKKAGGKVIQGLVKRREQEANLYFKSV